MKRLCVLAVCVVLACAKQGVEKKNTSGLYLIREGQYHCSGLIVCLESPFDTVISTP